MFKGHISVFLLLAIVFTGCAGLELNTVEKTKQLSPGMTQEEVVKILGEPKSSSVVGDKWVLTYTLHEYWKGWVPYRVEFDKKTKRLASWYADETEYERLQKQMTPSLGTTGAAATGPNDPEMMKWMAGSYYSYSGSSTVTAGTERRLVLCPDGSFWSSSESGYSGGAGTAGAWGAASQSGTRGSWAIQGNQQQGTITLNYSGGGRDTVNFRAGSDRGCFYFNNTLFCYEGAPNCR